MGSMFQSPARRESLCMTERITSQMPTLVVRRTGNSVGLPIPHELVHDLGLTPGDEVLVKIERIPAYHALGGKLKGRLTADEFTRLSNEGEELA
jgi:hypothetical protein